MCYFLAHYQSLAESVTSKLAWRIMEQVCSTVAEKGQAARGWPTQRNGGMCRIATITFDPTSGQRSYSNLENFHEIFGGTKLQGKG